MKQTILLQRGTIDISRDWANLRPLPVRHLLKGPKGDTTLCGHRFEAGDTLEDSEMDPRLVACDECVTKGQQELALGPDQPNRMRISHSFLTYWPDDTGL